MAFGLNISDYISKKSSEPSLSIKITISSIKARNQYYLASFSNGSIYDGSIYDSLDSAQAIADAITAKADKVGLPYFASMLPDNIINNLRQITPTAYDNAFSNGIVDNFNDIAQLKMADKGVTIAQMQKDIDLYVAEMKNPNMKVTIDKDWAGNFVNIK